MYLTPTENHWIIDVETDGLRDECTQIFVVCVENAVTDEKHEFTNKEEFNGWISGIRNSLPWFVGHNSIAFDVPVLNRLWGARLGISRIVDTFVLSMLFSPQLKGGHSLEAWGERVGLKKLAHKDFTQYSEEMLVYCRNDVALTKLVLSRLTQRMRKMGFTELGAKIETLHWHIIQNKQRRYGFPFDYERAHKLQVELTEYAEALKEQIYEYWPPTLQCIKRFAKAFKQDGTPTANYARHVEQYPQIELHDDGGYSVFDWVEFNLASPPQRVSKLLEAGWEPTVFTKKTEKGGGGNPKVDEDSLKKFAEETDNDAARALAKWLVVKGRLNNLNDWMNNFNQKTGAIHGNLWLAGTLRYRHDNPNTANIPAVRLRKDGSIVKGEEGAWTYEARDLWTCGDRYKYSLVGVDAKGIQLRILAHYLNDEEFSKGILSEDPHSYNQTTWELDTRAKAKTILYAIVMGAGDGRVASEAKISLKDAKATKKQLFSRVPGFEKLIKRLTNEFNRTGRIKLCDGTPVAVPKDYRVIPYLLQGDESRIMRQASILLHDKMRRFGIEAYKVGDIHDEWQFVVLKEHVEKFIELALEAFVETGKLFNYNIPIEGDAKVGKTWAETH